MLFRLILNSSQSIYDHIDGNINNKDEITNDKIENNKIEYVGISITSSALFSEKIKRTL